ncbi:Heterogeneous nuclear ribonucleoprotein H2 [Paragonimus heterotremus]|uniref:Heterogeneous nuclear ribonucleoprotein H2 n=1 Tax=Paragonimus heterotremus TaxID=100268 RepID=A0A8J4WJQ9_9TREM|nr:Heterogeneous nuclear ribonucleoprotein H2 [Paragonimus heterotremus]
MAAVVRIRGLPYSARADDIIEFFKDVKVKGGKRGIFFPQGPNGRSNGEAFIELESPQEIVKATSHHNEHMGRRYIEVFESSKQEMNNAMGKNTQYSQNRREYVVRLRGLPYDTEKKEIYAFFNGLEIAPNGIGLLVDHMGRCTGEAYVQFTSSEMLARAKEKHMEKIGHRYIEIFESSMLEANSTIQRQMEANQNRSGGGGGGPIMGRSGREHYPSGGGYYGGPRGPYGGPPNGSPNGPSYGRGPPPSSRPGPYARPYPSGHPGYDSPPRAGPPSHMGFGPKGGYNSMSNPEPDEPQSMTGHSIRLRGLPYSATIEDIDRFLAPLQPVNIRMRMTPAGRPTGEAMVDFASHDEAKEAMKKDREKIGSRYIELFLLSTPMGNSPSRMNGPPYGSRSYGPPSPPPYGSSRSMRGGSHFGDAYPPYGGGGSDYGPDDVPYGPGPMGRPDYGTRGPDGYYGGSNGMGPAGDAYSGYRSPPYRQGNYHWS